MRSYHRLRVHLSKQDREEVQELLRGGLQPVRAVLRALALWQLAAGQTAAQVAANLDLTPKAVRQIGGRYQQQGLKRALYDQQRPGAIPALDANRCLQNSMTIQIDPSPEIEAACSPTVGFL